MKGCLDGPTLQSVETSITDETGNLATPFTYQLKGDKELLKRMREEHGGKVVEVKGILKSNAAAGQRDPRQDRRKDQNYVSASAHPRPQGAGPDLSRALPVLEVKSYEGSGRAATDDRDAAPVAGRLPISLVRIP